VGHASVFAPQDSATVAARGVARLTFRFVPVLVLRAAAILADGSRIGAARSRPGATRFLRCHGGCFQILLFRTIGLLHVGPFVQAPVADAVGYLQV